MTKEERIEAIIDEMEDSELVGLWNVYCEHYGYDDDRIYYMGDIDELYHGVSVREFLSDLSDDFRIGDDYFKYGVFGIESFDDVYDVIDADDLITYAVQYDDALDNKDIREVLDSDEDETE